MELGAAAGALELPLLLPPLFEDDVVGVGDVFDGVVVGVLDEVVDVPAESMTEFEVEAEGVLSDPPPQAINDAVVAMRTKNENQRVRNTPPLTRTYESIGWLEVPQ